MDGWMDGWLDGWMDGWMDGTHDESISNDTAVHKRTDVARSPALIDTAFATAGGGSESPQEQPCPGKTLPLPCVSAAFVAKTLPILAVVRGNISTPGETAGHGCGLAAAVAASARGLSGTLTVSRTFSRGNARGPSRSPSPSDGCAI